MNANQIAWADIRTRTAHKRQSNRVVFDDYTINLVENASGEMEIAGWENDGGDTKILWMGERAESYDVYGAIAQHLNEGGTLESAAEKFGNQLSFSMG